MSDRKRVLWLVSWYPNKDDAFDGDFIQRHARAAAVQDDVYVLHVRFTSSQKVFEEVVRQPLGLTEHLVYLPKRSGLVGRLLNPVRWYRRYRQVLRRLFQVERFDLIHVHVPWKAGLLALWAARRFGLRYAVTEHWGIYNNVVADNIHRRNYPMRALLKQVYRGASAFTTVSRYLGEGVSKTLTPVQYTVIPNVVDTSLFRPGDEKFSRFTFLHVSNMVPLKDVDGLLQAFCRYRQQAGGRGRLLLIGNRDDRYPQQARALGLSAEDVDFLGEVTYADVAAVMRQAHVLVLNSHIENSPCVISEALCCGLPVIATQVGGIPELVSSENGLLISPRDPAQLADAMREMEENSTKFNPASISAAAHSRFSVAAVAAKFHVLYTVLTRDDTKTATDR